MSFVKLKDAESHIRVIALLTAGVLFYVGWHTRVLDFGRITREHEEWRIGGQSVREVLPHLTIPLGGLGILAMWYVLCGARKVARRANVSLFTALTFAIPGLLSAFYLIVKVSMPYVIYKLPRY